jgi:hypothetical protein
MASGEEIDIFFENANLFTALKIYEKVVDELIGHREAMLQIFLGTGAFFAAVAGWYAAKEAPSLQLSMVFLFAVVVISLVSRAALGVLQQYARNSMLVLNACEEMFGCWEEGRFLPGRTMMPLSWRNSSSKAWSEAVPILHRKATIYFFLGAILIVGFQHSVELRSLLGKL